MFLGPLWPKRQGRLPEGVVGRRQTNPSCGNSFPSHIGGGRVGNGISAVLSGMKIVSNASTPAACLGASSLVEKGSRMTVFPLSTARAMRLKELLPFPRSVSHTLGTTVLCSWCCERGWESGNCLDTRARACSSGRVSFTRFVFSRRKTKTK